MIHLNAMATFEALFCETRHCTPAEFPERAFRECLYPRARRIAPLLRLIAPDFFEADYEFIHRLGAATSINEAKAEASTFGEVNHWPETLLRSKLRIRVSGHAATRLAYELFSSTNTREKPTRLPPSSGGH